MAQGDITWFDDCLTHMIDSDQASTDHLYLAILDNTTAPAADDADPVLGDYTEVGTGGTYTSGGTDLGTIASVVTQTSGTLKIDSGTNPSWAQDASNDSDAYWGLIYNYTNGTKFAWAFVDLGGPFDMSGGSLTVTWNASGILTGSVS